MASPSPGLYVPSEVAAHDDMDDISITSTDQEDVDENDANKDWFVDDVYAERPDPENPGETQYLIKWEGFPLDQCTWEPLKNFGPGLLLQWEETKKEIAAGNQKAFDVEEYNAACRAKTERHMRRNAKRKRLGLPLTEPLPAELPVEIEDADSDSGASKDVTSPEAEAQEREETTPSRVPPQTQPQHVIKQKIFRGIPSPKVLEGEKQDRPVNRRRPSQVSPTASSFKASLPAQPAAKPAASNNRTKGGTMTGYQGTARKPSTSIDPSRSKTIVGKGPNQRKPSSTPRPASILPAPPPKPSSSLANKFAGKRLTATRTRPQPAAPSAPIKKILKGGKERKKRVNLGDAMNDPTKAPKAFSTMRVRNLAKKRGIERSDNVPPSISSIPTSFILTNNEPHQHRPDQMSAKDPSSPSEGPSFTQSPVALSPVDTSAATSAPKVKKSVRFTEVEDVEPEDHPMTDAPDQVLDKPGDVDPPLSASEPVKQPPSAPRKLSLANYQGRGQTQVVAKTVVFGSAGSNSVGVLFNGIARQSQPWLSAFIAQETLHFDTTCASYNFISQQSHLLGEILSAGAVEPPPKETTSALANVAENLQRCSFGFHMVADEFSILVYPSASEDWKGLGFETGTVESQAPLKHMIYKSQADPKLFPPNPLPEALDDKEQRPHSQIINDLTGLDYSRFLPQAPKMKDNQVFMLLIPQSEMQVGNVIKFWLRSYQPDCRIFSHEYEESWARFHEAVRVGKAGTVIFHENVTCSIRKIPRIFQMVDNKRCYTFWDLATGQFNPPRFPSDMTTGIEPGTLQLTRLFPHGRAFLITPSFALSEPERLCQFLEWFKSYCCNPNYLIVAGSDFLSYLKAVTLEKEEEYDSICRSHRGSNSELDRLLDEFGLSRDELEARFRAWQILNEIIKEFGDEDTSEDIRKVQWITHFIDPNDEQSLVNWFCWWSTTKLDRYRKFTVLGSSARRRQAAYRIIEIPAYTDLTVNDPDLALAREIKERKAREAALEAADANEFGDDVSATPTDTNAGVSTDASTTPTSQVTHEFRSAIFKSDRADDLRGWIDEFIRSRGASWARLHTQPVSWPNVSMADHFGDLRCAYDTYKNWLGHAPVFTKGVNTWYGLFYTIDKDWNSNTPPGTYGRHPWIAVFRPHSPHVHRYARMELFIWDVAASERRRVWGRSRHLLDMQCRLVNLLREEVPLKCQGYYLDAVYVSSRTELKYTSSDNPLDITSRRIREMMDDGQYWLPPFEKMLYSRGWDLVEWSNCQEAAPGASSSSSSGADPRLQQSSSSSSSSVPGRAPFPKHHSDDGKPLRSIFHAPAPKPEMEGVRSKCANDLYEAAYGARLKDEAVQTVRYQYKPTLEWYHDLKNEGRDASHVSVDSADKVLNKLLQKKY
ncbi:hypothetical protein F5B20DRAFT_555393 [Whalleya microplaca]|nr:hypothetical protein F5B20DRAFT_555393 [Whalleya microplaca]